MTQWRKLSVLLLVSSSLIAQQTSLAAPGDSKPEQKSPTTTIVSRTELVLVPVVVTDKSGKHIQGISKDAFRIEENGKEQKVATFEELQTGTVRPSVRVEEIQGYSNFALRDSHPYRVTIIVLDLLNTPYLAQTEAKRQLVKYLSRSLRRDEPTALFGLNRKGLHQLVSFTTDPMVLMAAMRKVRGEISQGEVNDSSMEKMDELTASMQDSSNQAAQQIADFMNDAEATIAAFQQRQAITETLESFNQIARAYSAVPGRKTLIWASAGFPFMIDDPQSFARMGLDMAQDYEATWRSLMSANIAVYPVDVQGLVNSDFQTGGRMSATRSGFRGSGSLNSQMRMPYDRHQQQVMSLRAFADSTGGRACANDNDLASCFARAVEDSSAYYMLGFYLSPDDRAPGWRKLKVKVAAEGAHVHAREGFYVSGAESNSPEQRRKATDLAITSPVEFTGVHFAVVPLPPAPDAPKPQPGSKITGKYHLVLKAADFYIDRQNNNAFDLDIALIAFDKKGNVTGNSGKEIRANLKPETLARISERGLGVTEKIDFAPETTHLKVVLRDNGTGRIGTVNVPIKEN
jgi:VWFA-related protein